MLGSDMVDFWHRFCLLRASMQGQSSAGEDALSSKLKELLEDGECVTEQVVHDLMMLLERGFEATNPRLKKIVTALRAEAERSDEADGQ